MRIFLYSLISVVTSFSDAGNWKLTACHVVLTVFNYASNCRCCWLCGCNHCTDNPHRYGERKLKAATSCHQVRKAWTLNLSGAFTVRNFCHYSLKNIGINFASSSGPTLNVVLYTRGRRTGMRKIRTVLKNRHDSGSVHQIETEAENSGQN